MVGSPKDPAEGFGGQFRHYRSGSRHNQATPANLMFNHYAFCVEDPFLRKTSPISADTQWFEPQSSSSLKYLVVSTSSETGALKSVWSKLSSNSN